MKTLELTLYSDWASALINGDLSGVTEEDTEGIKSLYDVYLAGYSRIDCVDVEEESHFGRPEWPHNALAGDICDYTFLIWSDTPK